MAGFIVNDVEVKYCAYTNLPDGSVDRLYTDDHDAAESYCAKGNAAGLTTGVLEVIYMADIPF